MPRNVVVELDVLVSLVFYIGTSYLMNVHFGSKDFHLSCGFSFMKKTKQNEATPNRCTAIGFLTLTAFKKNNRQSSSYFDVFSIIHSSVPHGGMICVDPDFSEPQ